MLESEHTALHNANCDSLIQMAEKYLPELSTDKLELIRVIEAYRERPDLLSYVEELEQTIFSLIRAYFGENG